MTTVTVKAILGRQRDTAPAPRSPVDVSDDVSRTARLLALAHKVRRLLDEGALPDQAEAAARLGWSFPQLTRVLGLTYLSPAIQERILLGKLVVSENRLRLTTCLPNWEQQVSDLDERLLY